MSRGREWSVQRLTCELHKRLIVITAISFIPVLTLTASYSIGSETLSLGIKWTEREAVY